MFIWKNEILKLRRNTDDLWLAGWLTGGKKVCSTNVSSRSEKPTRRLMMIRQLEHETASLRWRKSATL